MHQPTPSVANLLNDDQMKRFIANGFLPLNANVPRSVHETIRKSLSEAVTIQGHGGNNTLPQVPELQQVFDSPTVVGALTSVLGPAYVMHQHRHTHGNDPASQAFGWHRDSYWGYKRPFRDHRPWWVMIMYFPQDTPLDLGPTAVMPGAHNWETKMPGMETDGYHPLAGDAGTFALVHFDLWHAATPNISNKFRHMCKFQFVRLETPTAPSWNCADTQWHAPTDNLPAFSQRAMWRDAWDWFAGREAGASLAAQPGHIDSAALGRLIDSLRQGNDAERCKAADELGQIGPDAAEAIPALSDALSDAFEGVRLNAAYALASIGPLAVPALHETLHGSDEARQRLAVYALGAVGRPATDTLLEAFASPHDVVRSGAAFALGMTQRTGRNVVDALAGAARDASAIVRHTAIDALGQIGVDALPALPALVERLKDEEPQARFNAALAIARIGPAAEPAVATLRTLFLDPNRYVRGSAIEALHRIGTPQAIDAIIHQLKMSRWCPITGIDSHFHP